MTLYDYKARGHVLIDQICTYGYTKSEVYEQLEKRLGTNWRYAHFANVKEVWQAKLAIRHLTHIKDRAVQKYGKQKRKVPRRSKYKGIMLSHAEMKAALAKLNNKPPTLWQRIKRVINM